MARKNKLTIEFAGFEEMMAKLDKIGGSDAMKKGVEKAMIASKKYVNPLIEKSVQKANLPAKGKYGDGKDLRQAIDIEHKVDWSNMTASTNIGFRWDKPNVGMLGIYMIYGTQEMDPARGLKSAMFGKKTRDEIAKIQEEIVSKTIKDIMEGK